MNTYAIYFSPTGGTEKVVRTIAQEFGDHQEIDLSRKNADYNKVFSQEDLCIIGVPAFGGRVPDTALERIKQFRGNSARAVLVITYGNRAYDDTVRELADCLESRGFRCASAITAVTEHSIMRQFASGRPNEADKKELAQFACRILEKLGSNESCEKPDFPGNFPYREYNGVPFKPKAGSKCTNCGLCAALCPVGAISPDDPKKTNEDLCISCMRCISVCPNNARKLNGMVLKIAGKKMEAVCSEPKQNELFI